MVECSTWNQQVPESIPSHGNILSRIKICNSISSVLKVFNLNCFALPRSINEYLTHKSSNLVIISYNLVSLGYT